MKPLTIKPAPKKFTQGYTYGYNAYFSSTESMEVTNPYRKDHENHNQFILGWQAAHQRWSGPSLIYEAMLTTVGI